jgi:hypothetical protein
MKFFAILLFSSALMGCVSGPPQLTYEQHKKASEIKIFKVGTSPDKEFSLVAVVEAADCTGPGGSRLYGDEGKALDILKMKAAAVGADALSDVSCVAAPFVNNCWAAKKCDGKAINWK